MQPLPGLSGNRATGRARAAPVQGTELDPVTHEIFPALPREILLQRKRKYRHTRPRRGLGAGGRGCHGDPGLGPTRTQVPIATPAPRSAAEAPTALPRSPGRGGGRAAGGRGGSAQRIPGGGGGRAAGGTGGHFLSADSAQQGLSPLAVCRHVTRASAKGKARSPGGHVGNAGQTPGRRRSAKSKTLIKGDVLISGASLSTGA